MKKFKLKYPWVEIPFILMSISWAFAFPLIYYKKSPILLFAGVVFCVVTILAMMFAYQD